MWDEHCWLSCCLGIVGHPTNKPCLSYWDLCIDHLFHHPDSDSEKYISCLGALIFHCWRCPPLYRCHFFILISFQLLKLNLLCFAAPCVLVHQFFTRPNAINPSGGPDNLRPSISNFFIFQNESLLGPLWQKRMQTPPPTPPSLDLTIRAKVVLEVF